METGRPRLGNPKISNRLLNRVTWRSLEEVQDTLAWNDQEIANKLSLSLDTFVERKKSLSDLPASSLLSLSSALGLDPETLAYGKFDRPSLREAANLALSQRLPERYSLGAFSRRRTSLHLLKFTDDHFGSRATFSLLKKLQVRRDFFNSPDDFINIQFLADACNHLKSLGLPEERFHWIGMRSAVVNQNSLLAEELRKAKTVTDALDLQINHLVHFYDRNYRYWVKHLSSNACIFACVEQEEVQEAMSTRRIGSKLTCLTRVGVSSAITTLLKLPFAPVKKLSCVHEGDSCCQYFIDLAPAQYFKEKNLRIL